ncbi:hypothetical protein SAMN05878482_109101 [Peribacillus simplex]|uniref:Uncharacterized protein n=1 Tax=Peribacillus simplex TaxID=1478 RepID=A0A9X8WMW4_9BACI|nr:hypothetical protein SAMN05878482_109101 [Peribacillus simplex]
MNCRVYLNLSIIIDRFRYFFHSNPAVYFRCFSWTSYFLNDYTSNLRFCFYFYKKTTLETDTAVLRLAFWEHRYFYSIHFL